MSKEIVMDEGVESMWVYHLKRNGEFKALCGHQLLGDNLPLKNWGYVSSHIGEKYCKKCEEIHGNMK